MKAKAFALHLLYFKEQGYTIGTVLRKSARQYLFLFLFPAICVLLNQIGYLGTWGVFFITGLVVGTVARDVGWIRKNAKVWDHYDSMIDWSKVRQIAEQETADPPSEKI